MTKNEKKFLSILKPVLSFVHDGSEFFAGIELALKVFRNFFLLSPVFLGRARRKRSKKRPKDPKKEGNIWFINEFHSDFPAQGNL